MLGVDENVILRFMSANLLESFMKMDGRYLIPYQTAQRLSIDYSDGSTSIFYRGTKVYEEVMN